MSKRKTLRIKEVIDRTGLSRATIYRQAKKGQFPSPVGIGTRSVGWLSDQLDQWFEERQPTITPEPDAPEEPEQ